MSEVSASLRQLLEKNTLWRWDEQQQSSFQKLKIMTTNAPMLRYFGPRLLLTLSVDATQKGLGAVILQEGNPREFVSRALTASQQRYAQIEKETLAIVYGCEKLHQYIFGRKTKVETDHKPLPAIFEKPLYQTPPRLQRLLLTLQKYDLHDEYKEGKLMYRADLEEPKENLVPDLSVNELNLLAYLPISEQIYSRFQKAASEDEELQEVIYTITEGWPSDKYLLSERITPYWSFRDEISCVDGLLFNSHKLVIPKEHKQKHYYDQHSKPLEPLQNGQKVFVHNREKWAKYATVQRKHHTPRSYIVCTDDGNLYRRNRRHLRPTNAYQQHEPQENQVVHQVHYRIPQQGTINTREGRMQEIINSAPQSQPVVTKSGMSVQMPLKLQDYVR